MKLEFKLNGKSVKLNVPGSERLIDLLRERLDLVGTKEGCGTGECGACTVLIDGQTTLSCLTLAAQVEGREVTTIEGIGTADQPLTDKTNIGEPATDVIVRISPLEETKYSGGQPLFVQGDPLFELVLDDKGGYSVQLPQGQYMLEVIGKEGKALAKQMITLKSGQSLRADFNVAK